MSISSSLGRGQFSWDLVVDGSRGFGTNGMGLGLDNNGIRKENLPKRVD